MNTLRGRHLALAAAGLVAAPLLLLSGCSGGGGDAAKSAAEPAMSADSAAGGQDSTVGDLKSAPADAVAERSTVRERSVISTGRITLRSKDVAAVRDDVIGEVRRLGGFVADEDTGTDAHGRTRSTSLVVRIPSAKFTEAMASLSKLGRLVRATRSAEDVTTQVLDVDARVHAQEVGLKRLETLLGRAGRLSDVLAVERQITDRQAELDSLRSQQAYLSNQTSLASITVRVTRTAPPVVHEAHSGFWYGLKQGWHGLAGVASAALTAFGAVLPFALVLAVLGWPAMLIWRRVRRAPVAEDQSSA